MFLNDYLEVQVICNGETLAEYDKIELDSDAPHQPQKLIQAQSGAPFTFSVRCKRGLFLGDAEAIAYDIHIDGNACEVFKLKQIDTCSRTKGRLTKEITFSISHSSAYKEKGSWLRHGFAFTDAILGTFLPLIRVRAWLKDR